MIKEIGKKSTLFLLNVKLPKTELSQQEKASCVPTVAGPHA